MSLSRLELVGFKSFMSPVNLQFREGITAILGPNGCGKTNVVDAVRWVLGEQSARQLRSSKMENVIFNGTQVHKPLGYAQVNLTVSNERGVFPVDYSEITISRKVYRSGISEYFINKTPCRLRDIRELFADTGTGSHSYAVIEQEMVEYVLNDAHGERRNMFEEASGIVKYRMRREEAKRKLKLTDSDLTRLDDILEELGKNVRSLRYQVGKTKRYKNLSERIREWGLVLLRGSLSSLLKDKLASESQLSESLQVSRTGDDSLGEQQKKVEEEKLRLVEYEQRNSELQNQRYEIRKTIQVSEEKIIQNRERKGEAERKIERATGEIEEAMIRLEKIKSRVSGVMVEEEVTAEKIGLENEAVKSLGGKFEEISFRIERIQSELIDLKQTQLDFLQDQVRVKSSQEHYESVLSELDERSRQMRERIVELETAISALSGDRNEKETIVTECQQRLESLERSRAESLERVDELEGSISRRESALSESKTELAKLKSRHELFSRMKENFEGFPGGARYILQNRNDHVRGPLAEVLKIDDSFRPALESVLGGMTDGVVVDNMTGAMDIIEELAEKKLGGVRLFVEDSPAHSDEGSPGGFEGMIGRLSSLIDVEDAKRGMIDQLLGRTIVFETVGQAVSFIRSEEGRKFDAVTVTGVYFCRNKGIYFSGSPGEEVSLLGRSEEIKKMSGSISSLGDKVAEEERFCDSEKNEKAGLREKLVGLDSSITTAREELSTNQENMREVEREHIMKKEKCSLLMKSMDEIESSRFETLSKLEEARLALAMQQDTGDVSKVSGLEGELDLLQKEKAALETALTEKKVELASLQGILDKHREEIRGLGEMEKQFESIVRQRTGEIEESRKEASELNVSIEEERKIVSIHAGEERSFQKEIDELTGLLEEKRSIISSMEGDLKKRQQARDEIFTRINDVKIRLTTIDTKIGDMVERAMELYQEDLSCYLEGREIPLTEDDSDITHEMLENEKRKLDSLGPVNLAAIEEYDEKKERLDFLESQKEDLVKAKAELEEAITVINKRARKLFVETFEIVKGYFSEIFEVLFEGGEASLSLSEGSDPLEADIIISARPKGKRLQDISLLSGGERALTAISLLFALYKAKPSPFCIFDEVDAPLDDANIQRFVKMLKKFSEETQFIIITHNKRTMEAADSLFGVTMQEKGVSKIVSVNLTEIEEVMEARAPKEKVRVEAPVSAN